MQADALRLNAAINIILGTVEGDWRSAGQLIEIATRDLINEEPDLVVISSTNNERRSVAYGFDHGVVGHYSVSRCNNVVTISRKEDDISETEWFRHFLFIRDDVVHSVVAVRYRVTEGNPALIRYLAFRSVLFNLATFIAYLCRKVLTFDAPQQYEFHTLTATSFVPDIAIVKHSIQDLPIGVELPFARLEEFGFW